MALFGRRSTRAGFVGILAFTVPLTLLQISVREDRASTLALSPYTAWVIGYDPGRTCFGAGTRDRGR